jgi:hypothetical protein
VGFLAVGGRELDVPVVAVEVEVVLQSRSELSASTTTWVKRSLSRSQRRSTKIVLRSELRSSATGICPETTGYHARTSTNERQIAGADRVVHRWTWRATH